MGVGWSFGYRMLVLVILVCVSGFVWFYSGVVAVCLLGI